MFTHTLKTVALLACITIALPCLAQQKSQTPAAAPDTAGLTNIEARIADFEPIVNDMCNQISRCNHIDSIRRFAAIIEQISDTLMNHIVPVFDRFYAHHQQQVMPLKNINALSNRMVDNKKVAKAKKLNQKMEMEYAALLKAK